MDYTINLMNKNHWNEVKEIYLEGIKTKLATFQTNIPSWEEWNTNHIKECRLVAISNEKVIGWAALSSVSSRCVYNGVAEVSIYVKNNFKGYGVASSLISKLISLSEKHNYWSLQAVIIKENIVSKRLHEKCGFREIGIKEKIAKMDNDIWMDVVLMERRSKIIGLD